MNTLPHAHASETIHIDLPATFRLLGVVSACLSELIMSIDGLEQTESLIYGIQLAVHEICTNIVEHAYGAQPDGRIYLDAGFSADTRQLLIELRDTGKPFDPAHIPDPSFEEPQDHGYGLYLVRELMDEVSYTPEPSGNRWNLRKAL